MMATMSGTFTKDIKDIRFPASGSAMATASVACQRCSGNLVDEPCMDVGESGSGQTFWGQRCIQCGDVIDETILRNRFSSIETQKTLLSRTRSRTHEITGLAMQG